MAYDRASCPYWAPPPPGGAVEASKLPATAQELALWIRGLQVEEAAGGGGGDAAYTAAAAAATASGALGWASEAIEVAERQLLNELDEINASIPPAKTLAETLHPGA